MYKNVLDYFLSLKLFPGDPILEPPDFRDPLLEQMRLSFF